MFGKKSIAATLLLSCALAPAAMANNSALVDTIEGGCGLPDSAGGGVMVDANIVSSAQGGESHLTCKGDVTPPADGRAFKMNDFPCGMVVQASPGSDQPEFVVTEDSQLRISASGKAHLICHFSQ